MLGVSGDEVYGEADEFRDLEADGARLSLDDGAGLGLSAGDGIGRCESPAASQRVTSLSAATQSP